MWYKILFQRTANHFDHKTKGKNNAYINYVIAFACGIDN